MGRDRVLRGQKRLPIQMLLADAYAPFRESVRSFLGTERGLSIVGEASNGLEALELARQLKPQVVVMDISVPGRDGFEVTRVLKREMPAVQVILVSAKYPRAKVEAEAHRVGASLYLSKAKADEQLVPAIRYLCGLPRHQIAGPGIPLELYPNGGEGGLPVEVSLAGGRARLRRRVKPSKTTVGRVGRGRFGVMGNAMEE